MVKKSTTRKSTVKSTTGKKSTKPMRSFHIAKQPAPFMSTALTRQTFYWAIICVVIIVFTLWILKLQSDIQTIYDSIDINAGSESGIYHRK